MIFDMLELMQTDPTRKHTCAFWLYVRDGVNRVSFQPVCKDKYNFAVQVRKLHTANDNLA
jgi:hypothetical protein